MAKANDLRVHSSSEGSGKFKIVFFWPALHILAQEKLSARKDSNIHHLEEHDI